jgi:predicted amidohydrolase
MRRLALGLVHAAIQHGDPAVNRRELMAHIDAAAAGGAQIILAPEMAISGYGFDNRREITPFVETMAGDTLTVVAERARRHGVYICIGLALCSGSGSIFTNSAVLVDPRGRVACRYDKIGAESRWACPGDPGRDNTVQTPWGRLGILICSDTYHGLMPRVTALRGADLLLVPANWPPAGFDPRELWRARALENGIHLAVCNRTGLDRTMDFRSAASCLIDPHGETRFEGASPSGRCFLVDLPLTADGCLDQEYRRRRLSSRRPVHYPDCYLNLEAISDLTAYHQLPPMERVSLVCVVPRPGEAVVDALRRVLDEEKNGAGGLWLLPASETDLSSRSIEAIGRTAINQGIAVLTGGPHGHGRRYLAFQSGETDRQRKLSQQGKLPRQWELPPWPFDGEGRFPRIRLAGLQILLAGLDALAHPELAVAAAKRGCDLAVAMESDLMSAQRLLAGVRTIEQLAVAACAPNSAGIWTLPEGHQRWGETSASAGQVCRQDLDVKRLRSKRFQDRIDFKVLLAPRGG